MVSMPKWHPIEPKEGVVQENIQMTLTSATSSLNISVRCSSAVDAKLAANLPNEYTAPLRTAGDQHYDEKTIKCTHT